MNNKKIAAELLAETRTPQEVYKYAIRRNKGIEHSKTIKSNPFGVSPSTTIKQEPMGYIQPRGGGGGFLANYQNNNCGKYPQGRQNLRGNQYKEQHSPKTVL